MVLETQALDLARESNDNIKDEIWHELAQVQYVRWQQESAEQLQSQQQLQERMQQVLQLQHCREAAAQVLNCMTSIESRTSCCKCLRYYNWLLWHLRSVCRTTDSHQFCIVGVHMRMDTLTLCAHLQGPHLLALTFACIAACVAGTGCQCCLCTHLLLPPLQGAPPNVQQDQMLEREALGQVFQAAEQGLTAGEPASAFTCPLSMEVFRDPVMSPSGLSYERSALLEHLSKVRHHVRKLFALLTGQMVACFMADMLLECVVN